MCIRDRDEVPDAAVRRAADAAHASEFLDRLPNGFNTFLGERGVRLSGGQMQRLGLARALFGVPSLIVLDGVEVYNPSHLGGLFSSFIPSTVKHADLTRSSYGAHHGGRLGGVLQAGRSLWSLQVSIAAVIEARDVLRHMNVLGRSNERDRRPTADEIERIRGWVSLHSRSLTPDLGGFIIDSCFRTTSEIVRLRWADLNHQARPILTRARKARRRETARRWATRPAAPAHRAPPPRTSAHASGSSAQSPPAFPMSRPCLLYTSPSPRDRTRYRMPSSA